MPKFLTKLITEEIDSRYARIASISFGYYSDILRKEVWLNIGFVFDYESVPLLKGTSKRGGGIHDYLCRYDSYPTVTKKVAAQVYFEAMKYRDSLRTRIQRTQRRKRWRNYLVTYLSKANRFWRRWVKYYAVRIAWGYFHKYSIDSTYEEISGRKEISI